MSICNVIVFREGLNLSLDLECNKVCSNNYLHYNIDPIPTLQTEQLNETKDIIIAVCSAPFAKLFKQISSIKSDV